MVLGTQQLKEVDYNESHEMVSVLAFTQSSFPPGHSALPHDSSSRTLTLCFSGNLTVLLKLSPWV